MPEFFIYSNSFAAPFFSDDAKTFVEAATPREALDKFAASYSHPFGLYAAACYTDANAYHKGEKPLAKWICNHEMEKMKLTEHRSGYSYLGHAPGDFEIDGKRHIVANPKGGCVRD